MSVPTPTGGRGRAATSPSSSPSSSPETLLSPPLSQYSPRASSPLSGSAGPANPVSLLSQTQNRSHGRPGTPPRPPLGHRQISDNGHLSPPLPGAQRRASSPAPSFDSRIEPRRASSPAPPSYARSSLDRSPNVNPLVLDDRPRVPPPIYLRSSSPQPLSNKGSLKIHVPAWGVVLVRPPIQLELHPLESGAREPPTDDTVLSGALEVIMKERRRCQAISVGVQGVCRLHLGPRGWEEDGIFERGVEVLGGDSEGIWLEKGSQSFSFSILLPATLATHDYHQFCRLSYILTARVEGVASTSVLASFGKGKESSGISEDIEFKRDFETVIARSDKLAQDLALAHTRSRDSFGSPRGVHSPLADVSPLGAASPDGPDDSAIAIGEGSPSLMGLYHRRQSSDIHSIPHLSLGPKADDARSIKSYKSTASELKAEKAGWLKGDLVASRSLIVHANPSPGGGVYQLDIRKEGFVDGIGTWKFTASAEQFCIGAVCLVSLHIPCPSPKTTIFLLRLMIQQTYSIISPRTPNDKAIVPEAPKSHILYQVGRAHKSGERFPAHNVESLWRGGEAHGPRGPSKARSGSSSKGPGTGGFPGTGTSTNSVDETGWKTRAVARIPNHDKIRPSTNDGTITPIRVKHDVLIQVFYSIDGELVTGKPVQGPGELRMMQVRVNITIPSCTCTTAALNLPDYQTADAESGNDIDEVLNSPPGKHSCMCGYTFAELGEAAMRRLQSEVREEQEGGTQEASSSSASQSVKEAEARG